MNKKQFFTMMMMTMLPLSSINLNAALLPVDLMANEVQIGSDVTNTKPTGPVSIDNGSTVIHSSNVTIKNDFEVKTGAIFEIKWQKELIVFTVLILLLSLHKIIAIFMEKKR